MSLLYLYGIARKQRNMDIACTGIGGAKVQILPLRSIVAAVSELETWDGAVTEDNIWSHEHVIEAMMAASPVIPLRFGTVLADRTVSRQRLSQHYSLLMTELKRLTNLVELGLRIKGYSPPQTSERQPLIGPGTAYLLGLSPIWPVSVVGAVRQMLEPQAASTLYWPQDSSTPDLCASFLVEKRLVPKFRTKVAALRRELESLHISCSGPWPPYSFVGEPFFT